jgi:hypothetical protein
MIRYHSQPNLIGIELLNEPSHELSSPSLSSSSPSSPSRDLLVEFYQTCYELIRRYDQRILIVYNELYTEFYSQWRGQYPEPAYHNLIMDWHLYHWQDYYRDDTAEEHLRDVHQWRDLINNYSTSEDNPILIGEWSMSSGPALQVGQPFVTETIQSFAKSWCIGWYVWNWKIDQSTLVTTNTDTIGTEKDGGAGQEKENNLYDEWDVQLQSTLKSGLVIPFVV